MFLQDDKSCTSIFVALNDSLRCICFLNLYNKTIKNIYHEVEFNPVESGN